MSGWIGVDLDGTLATYEGFIGPGVIGQPIEPMVKRVKNWLREGVDVRIFTARVYSQPDNPSGQESAAIALLAIQKWCFLHLGAILPVTCQKDYDMYELWDDRAIQVIKNTGIPVGPR